MEMYECDNCGARVCEFDQAFCSEICRAMGDATDQDRPIPFTLTDAVRADNGPSFFSGIGNFVLPTDSEERKGIPVFSGVLNYFPLAIAAVARVSKRGNDKHNPGEPLHWSRGKSMDHLDCIARHLIDAETVDPRTGEYEDAMALAWRALAKLQELEEARLGKPMSRGSRLATPECGAV